jgi:hypothetical protein
MRTIKYCAMAIVGFVAGAEIFILLNTSDDRAGGVFMGILIGGAAAVISAAAKVFELILKSAVEGNRAV